MREIKRSYARPRGSFIHLQGVICDECAKPRTRGDHSKCSRTRQAKYEAMRASHEQGKDLLVPRPDAEAHAS